MNQKKILLLENVAAQAAGLREHLSRAGFQVAVSRYEADGLKRLAEWGPDLVLVSTAHPAGDLVEYCRRVRALAPAGRIIVAASLNSDRLFREHPGLQGLVDGVLLRPVSPDEIVAMLASAPAASPAPEADRGADPATAELRAEFQRQLDARFLEVAELKRRLEAATTQTAAAPDLAWLQSENARLRESVEEARKKAALTLATEQLKRSEIEVKLDNLLRMKEDFEFRAQNEIEDRTREIERVCVQLEESRERSEKETGELAALRVELERALTEKAQLEGRLHELETGSIGQAASPEAAQRLADLEAELSHQRAREAEGQVALADTAAKLAVLEESLAREQAARQAGEPLLALAQTLREQAAQAQREAAELREKHDRLQDRLLAAENAAAAAQAGLLLADERQAALAQDLADARAACEEDERLAQERRSELAVRTQELLERAAGAERDNERLRAACAALEERLAASESARISVAAEAEAVVEQIGAQNTSLSAELAQATGLVRELTTERDRLRGAREESQQVIDREVSALREQAAGAAQALQLLRSQQEQTARGHEEELAAGAERLEKALRDLEESERRVAALRVELSAAAQAHGQEIRLLKERAAAESAAAREAVGRAEVADTAQALELLRSQQEQTARGHEEELAASAERLEGALQGLAESERMVAALRGELAAAAQTRDQEIRLLKERAAGESAAAREAVGRAEAADTALAAARDDFAARLRETRLQLEEQQASCRDLEEKLAARAVSEAGASLVQDELRRIQELLEQVIARARTEAVDYARRDAELSVRLQAALEERRLLQERFDRANAEATERERRASSLLQSAIDHGPAWRAERDNLPAVLPPDPVPGSPRRRLVLAGLAVAALAVLLAVFGLRTAPPALREGQAVVPRPQPGLPPGPAATPPVVWDRWTRSDTSGGVLVQATLRSKQELRAEVEADSARGVSDEEAQAELARRLNAFQFDTTHYVTVYLKNLAPGYPAYLDDLPAHFRLRDSSGREVPAFVPPGHEKDRRIFSFGTGAPGGQIHEASVSLGFDRAGLSPSAGYLQLVVSDVGAASRRVLTWELE